MRDVITSYAHSEPVQSMKYEEVSSEHKKNQLDDRY